MPSFLNNKAILVTGGTGSIGSEIVRQCLAASPRVVRVFSTDDTKHFLLREELGDRPELRYLVGDVRDRARLELALKNIDVVFSAAGMKQVPLCEYNPFEAVQTNIIGTQNLIDAALAAGVARVIFISSDKATNPTTTMGATKLVAERLITSTRQWVSSTRMASVRFGNVLGSRGSVVPTIRTQIARGGPVTLTDGTMTRFAMSISQAVELVLEAAAQPIEGGEIFILKMPALRVADLLEVLVEELAPRYGHRPEDIRVETIGIRPGEKIDEELLTDQEAGRTEDLGRFLVVHPAIGGRPAGPIPPIPRKVFVSSDPNRKLLTRSEIARMLESAGLLDPAKA